MWYEFFSNKIIISVLVTLIIVNLIKFVVNNIGNKKWDWWAFVETGGMPSSHSAIVTSLVTSICLFEGPNSTAFIVALVFALVIIRDAVGVRRTVDKLINCVNKISLSKKINIEHIKTIAGHTPVQVLVGIIVGLIIPFIIYFIT